MKQDQFLDVVDEDEAHRRFEEACADVAPRFEMVALEHALGRVLAGDVRAPVDVPGFDRSNVDGFAVSAADTFGAEELRPVVLRMSDEKIPAGAQPTVEVVPGAAAPIATGGVLPRGADAVVMIEDTAPADVAATIDVFRPLAPGANVAAAGTDLGRGEVVLRRGVALGSRETGLLAAIGVPAGEVFARPRVAVMSTGDEVRAPGSELELGQVFDSNGRILCDAVRELGGAPEHLGIVPDDEERLEDVLRRLLDGGSTDVVLLSGGTSKGAGDLNHRVVAKLAAAYAGSPGVVVHGVALKPGKPLCLAVIAQVPIAILPGFPTSAVFTFHELVAPLLRRLAGRRTEERAVVEAVAPLRIPSATGRTEYCLVDLVPGPQGLAAYPLGSGSGSVSTFSRADGFVRIDRHTEYIAAGSTVSVRPLGTRVAPADLIAIGSHCIGLDRLLSLLSERGFATKMIAVGSQAGLAALARGEGDVAGTHLLDEATGVYNTPFLPAGVRAIGGYGRRQGVVFRRGDERFEGRDLDGLRAAAGDAGVRMVNRNPGSGTRILIDRFLKVGRGEEPPGYHAQARSHHAVAAAVAQGRADWGITLDTLAEQSGLAFVFVQDERFDLVVREDRLERPAVAALRGLLAEEGTRAALRELGLH
ncbi:MAG: molybdopterin biosynthesis protein [Planctomycetota bacterium]|nr:molybdopterin biosynthesis protein [Planctomycetota bacterium]